MKISNIRKYILFIIISFVVAIGPAMATDDFSFNGSGVKLSSERYIDLECVPDPDLVPDGRLKALVIQRENYTVGGESYYAFVIRNLIEPSGVVIDDYVTCSWSGERTNPAYEHEGSHRTYHYHYEPNDPTRITVPLNGSINGEVVNKPSQNIANLIAVRFNVRNVRIKSLTKDSNSERYVDWSGCPGDTVCVVTPTDAALNQGQNFTAQTQAVFTADGIDEKSVTLDFQISYTGGVNAYPGGYGTCSFDSNWRAVSFGSTHNYYVSVTSGNVTLPSCSPNSSPLPIEFRGWTKVPDGRNRNDPAYQHVGECAEGGKTVVAPGASVAPDSGIYVACYVYSDGVRLTNINTPFELSDTSQCTQTDNGEYFCRGTGSTFTLPNVVNNSTVLGQDTEFLGWLKNGSGELLEPGRPVSVTEGAYYAAQYKRTVRERDRYKSVYVGQHTYLSVPGMVGCAKSGTATNLDASFINNQCFVAGNSPTGSGEYIDVNVTVQEDGETRNLVYKFEVRDIGVNSEAGDGSFVIDVDANIVSGENNSYALNDFEHKMCDVVKIKAQTDSEGHTVRTGINDDLNSNNYIARCVDNESIKYFALCMDPGRVGPSDDKYDITEHVNQDSDLGKMIGVIIDYINKHSSKADFDTVTDPVRLAAHVAIRTVVLINGYSGVTEYSDQAYYEHYLSYEELAQKLKEIYENPAYQDANGNMLEDNSEFKSAITSAVDAFGVTESPQARTYLIEMFIKYKNYKFEEGGAFQRTIDSKDITFGDDGNSYTIVYKGTMTLPVNTRLTMGNTSNYQYLPHPDDDTGVVQGVKGTLVKMEKNTDKSTTDPLQEVYDYEVKIEVTDAKAVTLPKNRQEEEQYALEIKYEGGIDYSSIRIGNPYAGSASKQRMLVFDLNSDSTFIYFNIDGGPSICSKLESLDYTQCTDEDHCPSSFNKSLFKASGCCSNVLDEVSYQYVMKNVCNGDCSVSTMSSVCSYRADYAGSPDLYEVKEGAYYTGTEEKYTEAIGTCVVNVKDNYAADVDAERDLSVYQKEDDRGNSIMVASYQGNEYCQVSCREDWVITMEAFGNFVGKNAVLAGKFFQNANNNLFIQGGRTCYTTYLDYDLFMRDLVEQSKIMVNNYNTYSNASHAYTDIDDQDYTSDKLVFVPDSGCLQWTYNEVEDDEDTEEDESEDSDWECTLQNIRSDNNDTTRYGHYELSLNMKFQGDGDERQGSYNNYTVTDNVTSDPVKTPTKPDYSQDKVSGTACTFTSKPTSAGYDGQTAGENPTTSADGCYLGNTDTNKQTAFTNLSDKMKAASEAIMSPAYQKMTSAANIINNKYEQFWNCQHFELNNATDDANGKANNPASTDKSSFTGTKTFMQILTMFEPFVSYDYDEKLYMTILQDDNILIQYDQLNDKFFLKEGITEGFNKSTNKMVDAYVGFTDPCELAVGEEACEETPDTPVKLARNYLEFAYYDPEDGPWMDDDLIKKYGEGTEFYKDNKPLSIKNNAGSEHVVTKLITLCSIGREIAGTGTGYNKNGDAYTFQISERVPRWEGGKCYSFNVSYFKAHYIKASITNSSFYRNKGIWYTGPNDTREHGDDLEDAWDNAAKREGGPSYTDRSDKAKKGWSVFSGTMTGDDRDIEGNLNIFPVSMTTARNLYRYTYQFTQIGSYSDGQLGRVMGDAEALIPQNKRTCFYEVVEDICLCCGDPIVTYTSETETTAQEFASSVGFDYDFNRETEYDKARGTLGLYTTTVALSDLNSPTDRELGNNWTNRGVFYYGGNKLITNKGEVALKEIEEQGEKVYLNDGGTTPEYSFELRPTTLAAIRDYNDRYGYEVNFDNLTIYGRASIQPLGSCDDPSSCSWFATSDQEDDMNNYIANFGHYGSNFLENFNDLFSSTGASAGTNNLSNMRSENNVCEIVSSNSDSAKEELKNKIASGNCRWIDYIETGTAKNIWEPVESTQYYRLAFK